MAKGGKQKKKGFDVPKTTVCGGWKIEGGEKAEDKIRPSQGGKSAGRGRRVWGGGV